MRVELTNVRLSFPDLFKPSKFEGSNQEPKYGATFLVNKETQADQIKTLKTATVAAIKDKWGEKPPPIGSLKHCTRDGNDKEYDGYAGHVYVHATTNRRPPVIDRQLSPITESDDKVYPGCYVNAHIDLWAYDNVSRGIGATLLGIQFVRDGDPFGQKPFNAQEEFKALEPASTGDPFNSFGTQEQRTLGSSKPLNEVEDDLPF